MWARGGKKAYPILRGSLNFTCANDSSEHFYEANPNWPLNIVKESHHQLACNHPGASAIVTNNDTNANAIGYGSCLPGVLPPFQIISHSKNLGESNHLNVWPKL